MREQSEKIRSAVVTRQQARRAMLVSTGGPVPQVAALDEDGVIIQTFAMPYGVSKKLNDIVDFFPEAAGFEVENGLFLFRGSIETMRKVDHAQTSANPLYEPARLAPEVAIMQRQMAALTATVQKLRAEPATQTVKRKATVDYLKKGEGNGEAEVAPEVEKGAEVGTEVSETDASGENKEQE